MKHKLINFNLIVNNLIVHNLLINYLNLVKESIQRPADGCSVAILKNKNQSLADVLQNRSSEKFRNIQRKPSVLESFFNKVAALRALLY